MGRSENEAARQDPTLAAGRATHARLEMLDGWRVISIASVMGAHMLPLGPKSWNVNGPVAVLGMAIFFTLSGFLVVSILLRDQNILAFAIKRLARIVPLAWLVLAVTLALGAATPDYWLANFLFYANLPPFWLDYAGHFWSLGVEMQFYAAIGLVVAVAGRRGLWLVPVAAVAVTILRIVEGQPASIVTWFRIDEILAGGTLALLLHEGGDRARRWLARIPLPLVALPFLFSASYEWLNYPRAYLAATMVGITIVRPASAVSRALGARPARYLAGISYALYVFHPFTMDGWLGAGGRTIRYMKRPFSIALSFLLAHLSTTYFEAPINRLAHRVARRLPRRAA